MPNNLSIHSVERVKISSARESEVTNKDGSKRKYHVIDIETFSDDGQRFMVTIFGDKKFEVITE